MSKSVQINCDVWTIHVSDDVVCQNPHRQWALTVSSKVPPNIKGEEVNTTVMLGQSVDLQCQSDAVPPPTLSWRKDGRPLFSPLFRKPGLAILDDGSLLKVWSEKMGDIIWPTVHLTFFYFSLFNFLVDD